MGSFKKSLLAVSLYFAMTTSAIAADPGLVYVDFFTGLQGLSNITGVTADINLGPKFTLGVDYAPDCKSNFGVGVSDLLDGDNGYTVSGGKITKTIQAAHLRVYPMSGSFHATVIAGTSKGTVTAKVTAESSGETLKYIAKRDQTFAGLSVGNDFRFPNFVFGFEWIGYLQTLQNKTTYESAESSDAQMQDGISVAKRATANATIGGLSLLWFKIGIGL